MKEKYDAKTIKMHIERCNKNISIFTAEVKKQQRSKAELEALLKELEKEGEVSASNTDI